ncbi:MFS transporter [Aminipila butyrica]|uniref:MFS transporter n=1 Tax=Aminipila butyrica TaxID=433296 RepID=A0A858BWY8_9FIRM|nr:MFS transporter [Aminipila butyrica]QIB69234.1 MFS transporter [Aminipila butyrica]
MKLSLKIKTAYGVIAIADQCLYFLYGTFFLFFTTTVVGLDPGIAGAIAALGAIWDALSAAVIGFISDHTYSRFGKRRSFILCASIPVAIATTLLFTAIEADMTVKIIYYVCMTLIFWTGFASFFVPFLAWGAELTEDYNERTRLRSFAYVGNTLGMAIGAVLPTIFVDHLLQMGRTQAQAWTGTAAMVAGCVFLSLIIGTFIIKEPSNLEDKEKGEPFSIKGSWIMFQNLVKSFKEIFQLKALRYAVYGSVLYLAANTIFVADRLYFYTYNMGLDAWSITVLMAIEPFAGMLFVPILIITGKKLDKRSQYLLGMSLCALSMLVLRLVGTTNFLEAAFMLVAFGLGAICYWQLMPAMIYDVCEVDELASGKQRQGTIVSLQAMAESISEAIGLLLLGNMLQWAGFDGNAAVQQPTALLWVENAFTLIPGIFMFLSVYAIYKYPITRKSFNRVLTAVEKKRAGEEVDLASFKDVLG